MKNARTTVPYLETNVIFLYQLTTIITPYVDTFDSRTSDQDYLQENVRQIVLVITGHKRNAAIFFFH